MARQRKQRADHRADLRGKPFVGLPAAVLYSPAYQQLSLWGRAVLIELLGRFNGYNNGQIAVSQRELADRLQTTNYRKIGLATAELLKHGLVDIESEGKWKQRQARLYRLTFISTGIPPHYRPATNDYAAIPPQAFSGADDGSAGKPRPADTGSAKAVVPADTGSAVNPLLALHGGKEPADTGSTLIGKPSPVGILQSNSTPSQPNGPIGALRCEKCGDPFQPAGRGKPKRFCSEKCRKAEEAKRRHLRQRAAA